MTDGLRGALTRERACTLIAADAAALRAAAAHDLGARIAAAPEWSMADLVWHIGHVHWTWRTVITVPIRDYDELTAYPDIERPPESQLLEFAAAQAEAFVDAALGTPLDAPCWTWAPRQQDCAFVVRHQVQEAAVHRWDAQRAVGSPEPIDSAAAADAVEEFLTVSLASEAWPVEGADPLGAPLVLASADTGDAWTVRDAAPGTLAMTPGAAGDAQAVTVRGPASELLLWLYQRVPLPADGPRADEVVQRFRALSSTD